MSKVAHANEIDKRSPFAEFRREEIVRSRVRALPRSAHAIAVAHGSRIRFTMSFVDGDCELVTSFSQLESITAWHYAWHNRDDEDIRHNRRERRRAGRRPWVPLL